jgi:hypothetical protein
MKNNALILQSCINWKAEMVKALDWLEPIHSAYAEKWKMDYWANRDIVIETDDPEYNPAWDRIKLMMDILDEGTYEYMFWIDHDCVIVDFNTDLRSGLDDGKDFGLVLHPGVPGHPQLGAHFNMGVMLVRCTDRMTKFMHEVWDRRFSGPPWYEQDVVNGLLRDFEWMKMFQIADDKFNSTLQVNDSPEPVIAAFHGHGSHHDVDYRLNLMKQAAEHYKVPAQIEAVKNSFA